MEFIIIGIVFSFFIIYAAVRLAIKPLIEKDSEIIVGSDLSLYKLKEIGILNDNEFEEVTKIYKEKGIKKRNYVQYQKYLNVLNDLNNMGYISEEKRVDGLNKLKEYYEIK
jgi:hypothetical protein